jgi:hypothetical protein
MEGFFSGNLVPRQQPGRAQASQLRPYAPLPVPGHCKLAALEAAGGSRAARCATHPPLPRGRSSSPAAIPPPPQAALRPPAAAAPAACQRAGPGPAVACGPSCRGGGGASGDVAGAAEWAVGRAAGQRQHDRWVRGAELLASGQRAAQAALQPARSLLAAPLPSLLWPTARHALYVPLPAGRPPPARAPPSLPRPPLPAAAAAISTATRLPPPVR